MCIIYIYIYICIYVYIYLRSIHTKLHYSRHRIAVLSSNYETSALVSRARETRGDNEHQDIPQVCITTFIHSINAITPQSIIANIESTQLMFHILLNNGFGGAGAEASARRAPRSAAPCCRWTRER